MNSTLHLTLKRKWFDMIATGEKKEEYREIKPYWEKRFLQCNADLYTERSKHQCKKQQCVRCITESNGGEFKQFDTITFRNGYTANAPTMVVECLGIEVGTAKPEWSDNWNGEVFIIKLGKILKHPYGCPIHKTYEDAQFEMYNQQLP